MTARRKGGGGKKGGRSRATLRENTSMHLFLTIGLERIRPVTHTLVGELFQVPATSVGVSLWGLGYLGTNAIQLILLPNRTSDQQHSSHAEGGEHIVYADFLAFIRGVTVSLYWNNVEDKNYHTTRID